MDPDWWAKAVDKADVVDADWWAKAVEKADTYLRSIPPESLGPAGRILLGIKGPCDCRCCGHEGEV